MDCRACSPDCAALHSQRCPARRSVGGSQVFEAMQGVMACGRAGGGAGPAQMEGRAAILQAAMGVQPRMPVQGCAKCLPCTPQGQDPGSSHVGWGPGAGGSPAGGRWHPQNGVQAQAWAGGRGPGALVLCFRTWAHAGGWGRKWGVIGAAPLPAAAVEWLDEASEQELGLQATWVWRVSLWGLCCLGAGPPGGIHCCPGTGRAWRAQ
jgi:hypothetical protein